MEDNDMEEEEFTLATFMEFFELGQTAFDCDISLRKGIQELADRHEEVYGTLPEISICRAWRAGWTSMDETRGMW